MVKASRKSSSIVSSSLLDSAKVRKHHGPEQVEIRMYLAKLKQLVPNMPRHRKVSKVEVINNVIDYICDLQMALDHHHPAGRGGAAALVSVMLNNNNTTSNNNNVAAAAAAAAAARQPLCVIAAAPNATFANTCAQEVTTVSLCFSPC